MLQRVIQWSVANRFLVLLVTLHRYTIGVASIAYALSAPLLWVVLRYRTRNAPHAPPAVA